MRYDFYPEKAQYRPGEDVRLCCAGVPECRGTLRIYHLFRLIEERTVEVCEENPIDAGSYEDTFAGYGAELTLTLPLAPLRDEIRLVTAFDVTRDPGRVVRYGFLSDFGPGEDDTEDVDVLRRYHINFVQYYDWSYRHDDLTAEREVYTDMMGREVDQRAVRAKIEACRRYGMRSLGYGAVYAASRAYYEAHPEQGLYTGAGDPLVFIDTFYLMNVEQSCPWHDHIISEYVKAVREVGFDGIHMDTYGFPKTAFTRDGRLLRMDEHYAGLIGDAGKALDALGTESHLIFNNVGNWPVAPVAKTRQDAVYIEVWEPYTTYGHLRQIILDAQRACGGQKPVVLAAYLAPFRTDAPFRALNAARLLLAGTASCGASNLLLGEKNGVLTQGYYVDHSHLSEEQADIIRRYADFIVRYEELFFDTNLKDVSFTHIGWDNTEYCCESHPWSPDGQAGRLWLTLREGGQRKMISIVNLCGCDNRWNEGKETPVPQENVTFQVQVDTQALGVWVASPDGVSGMTGVPYHTIRTQRGWAVRFTLPLVEFWSLIYIQQENTQ